MHLRYRNGAALAAKARDDHDFPRLLIGGDPVAHGGLVASLSRPGGNVTGVTVLSTDLVAHRVGLVKEVAPGISRVAYLFNPANPGNVFGAEEFKKAALRIGLDPQSFPVRGPEEFASAFAKMATQRTGAVIVAGEQSLEIHRERLAELAIRHRLPSTSPSENTRSRGLARVFSRVERRTPDVRRCMSTRSSGVQGRPICPWTSPRSSTSSSISRPPRPSASRSPAAAPARGQVIE